MNSLSKAEDRQKKILDVLKLNKKMTIEEATALLKISISSARRLFIEMENSGTVVRMHGGIHRLPSEALTYSFDELASKSINEKQQIAFRASELLCNNDVVYFDSGTTILQLAYAVKKRISAGSLSGIKVITNSLANLFVLQDLCTVFLVGGEYHVKRQAFSGYSSEKFIQNFIYKKAFLGADGVDMTEGFMTTDTDTAKLNEIVIERSEKNYVLLDSSKFCLRSFVSYATTSDIKAIITDSLISKEILQQCAQAPVDVIVAEE